MRCRSRVEDDSAYFDIRVQGINMNYVEHDQLYCF